MTIVKMSSLGRLEEALHALGEVLRDSGCSEHLVVVGGVAMNLAGYASRATADVDVIARIDRADKSTAPILLAPDPLPESVRDGIRRVARDFGLAPDWINTVIARQWLGGLPPSLAEVYWHQYGGLKIGVPGREAMISLKLFAAVDLGPRSVHMQDLLRLDPSDEELNAATGWVRTQDVSEAFQVNVASAVEYVRRNRSSVG
jgi:hypothetical protein